MNILNQKQIKSIVKIALEAGEIAMSYFGGDNLNIRKKADDSPLTIADSLISKLIAQELHKITPNLPVICEEGENRHFGDGIFWLIDPIDGTNSFAANNPEFTINIALIKNKKPIFGLIFAPAIAGLPFYYTDEHHHLVKYSVAKNQEKIVNIKRKIRKKFIVLASKRNKDQEILDYFAGRNEKITIHKVSSSLKFIYLIEGKADLYLHLRKSMEWDIAAGQALLLAAGGKIINLDDSDFLYEKEGLENKPFVAMF
jgi:3'(2'), 5'-bisphosphate nucleotidase